MPVVGGAGLPTSNTSAPNAYLNYILFDDNYVPYDFGYDQVSEAGALPGGPDKMMLEAKVRKPGYLYIYVSNENPTVAEVYFDDLKIKHVKSPVLQYNEYYAYGLQTGNSWTREATTPNNFLGNSGTELNTTTSLYDLEYRNYDPALARMRQVDPLASKYASINPYNYSFNNPAAFTDPSGAEPANENYRYHREQSNQRVVDAGAFFRNTSFGAGVFRGGNPQSMFNPGWSPGSGSLSAGSFAGADAYFSSANVVYGTIKALYSANGGIVNLSNGKVDFFDEAGGMVAAAMYMTQHGTMTTSISALLNDYFSPLYASISNNANDSYFEGTRIIESEIGDLKRGAAFTLPGVGIFASSKAYDGDPKGWKDLLKHEFGHVLQAKEWGDEFFYQYIAPTSFISAIKYDGDHKYSWTERTANYFSIKYFGSEGWNHLTNPVYLPANRINNNDTRVPYKGLVPIWWDQRGEQNRN